ncbi:MAG: ABC transporter permease [Lachnospiraceae bacterium]|nr:ABC transporter permease [Lachnospiraceae bacterium]
MTLVLSVLEQGLIYGIMAMGVYITYKILDFPDMTVDGSFPMGAAITAIMISKDMNPLITLPICFGAGILVGICTGIIHVKLGVRDLLSGIIMFTGLYSVNLRIAGRANLPIYNKKTIFENSLMDLLPEAVAPYRKLILILILVLLVKYILDWYLRTRSGYLLRAVGDNETIVTAMGIDKGFVKILGLAIANGMVCLSGCIFAQQQRFFDLSMGTGTVVIGLASVIMGTSLLKNVTFLRATSAVLVGSLLYKACVAVAIRYMDSRDLKLVTAVLFLIILVVGRERKRKVKANA